MINSVELAVDEYVNVIISVNFPHANNQEFI